MTSNSGVENKGESWSGSDNVHYDYPGVKFALPRFACEIKINGATVTPEALIGILDMVTRPVPGRWYTFARLGDNVTVTHEQRTTPSPTTSPISPSQPNLASPGVIVDDDDC